MKITPLFAGTMLLLAACSNKNAAQENPAVKGASAKVTPLTPGKQATVGAVIKPAIVIEPKAAPAKGFSMRINPRVGSTQRYSATSQVTLDLDKKTMPPGMAAHQTVDMSVIFDVTAQKSENGVTEFKVGASKVVVVQDGKTSTFNATEALINVDGRCRVVTAFTDPVSAMLGLGFVPFPENRVLPGSSWRVEGKRDVPGFSQVQSGLPKQMEMTEIYKLVAGARDKAWTIQSNATAKGVTVSSRGTYTFDAKDGLLIGANVVQNAELDIPYGEAGKTVRTKARVTVKVGRR